MTTELIPLTDLPSTFDCPVEEGGDPDPVLATLVHARARYFAHPSLDVYVSPTGVCAIGAVIAEDGASPGLVLERLFLRNALKHEQYLRATTLEAIHLLEREARRRHRLRSLFPTRWTGHLERINQRGSHATPEILSIYDATIARRARSAK